MKKNESCTMVDEKDLYREIYNNSGLHRAYNNHSGVGT